MIGLGSDKNPQTSVMWDSADTTRILFLLKAKNSIRIVLFNGDFVHIELKKTTVNVQQQCLELNTQSPSHSFFSKHYIMESLVNYFNSTATALREHFSLAWPVYK